MRGEQYRHGPGHNSPTPSPSPSDTSVVPSDMQAKRGGARGRNRRLCLDQAWLGIEGGKGTFFRGHFWFVQIGET